MSIFATYVHWMSHRPGLLVVGVIAVVCAGLIGWKLSR